MTATSDPSDHIAWHISSYSNGGGGNCVEAGAFIDRTGRITVRDSTRRAAGTLVVDRRAWSAFTARAAEPR